MDLRAEFGEPRSQGNMGWCYANAAADLLSHKFRSELKGESISAVYIALNFNYNFFADSMREGGFIFLALQSALQSGACPQTLDLELLRYGNHKSLREKLNFVLDLKDKLDQGHITEVRQEITKAQATQSILFRLPVDEIMEILRKTSKRNLLRVLAERFCGDKKQYFSKAPRVNWHSTYTLSSDTRLMSKLNYSLDHNNPVGISYYSSFFDQNRAPKTSDSRHMSVVVGRRFRNGSCEYLIRNSWGSRCDGYKNSALRSRCEKGHIWIPQNVLAYYLYGVTYLGDID